MTTVSFILLTAALVSLSFCCSTNHSCPTWLYCSEEGWCSCGNSVHDRILCNNETQEVVVLYSLCITSFNAYPQSKDEVVGSCLYAQNQLQKIFTSTYVAVNPNISIQEEQLCGYLNRKGRLCGECAADHFVSPYSYDLKCNHCNGSLIINILKYFSVAHIPLTIFLILVFTCRISVTSPQLNMVVLLCQVYTSPQVMRVLIQNTRETKMEFVCKTITAIYGIWNLDFFRTLLPPICLPLNTMHVIALDYLVAMYPLFLLVCFYSLVTAHDKGFRLIIWVWRPFLRFTSKIRQQWNVRHSIIDAFATFILLSYVKFVNISMDLLIPTQIVNIHGSQLGYFWYYDATVKYIGSQHMPYVVIAVLVLVVGIMFPVLLILYPMMWFQNLLNKCGLNSPGLRMFIECFQGNFRDRSDGGWECRYYAALHPLLRMSESIIYAATRSIDFYPLVTVIIIVSITYILVARPYKKQCGLYNNLDAILLLSILGFFSGCVIHNQSDDWIVLFHNTFGPIMAAIFSLIPLAYFIALVCNQFVQIFKSKLCYCGHDNMMQPLLQSANSN